MIPLKLELHNFLAYTDPDPLDLTGIHVACISGENGAGKSSLLDAITWALWGKARAASADDLIHQSRRETRVALEFAMGKDEFRVVRQRSIEKKTPVSLLELQGRDPAGGGWHSLSEHNLRATQDRIDSLLHLDYDTFLNSALLAQGHADEFTAKQPAQRVEILASILGLDRWAGYEERAKESARSVREALLRGEERLAAMEQELGRRETYNRELEDSSRKAEAEAKGLEELETAWRAVEQQRAEAAELERSAADADRRRAAAERELAEARAELETLSRSLDLAAAEKNAAAARAEKESLAGCQSELEAVQARVAEITGECGKIRGENDALIPQAEPLKARLAALETTTDPACPTCGQPLTPAHRRKIVAELQADIDARRENFRKNTARLKELENGLAGLRKQADGLQVALRSLPAVERRLAELDAAAKTARDAAAKMPAAQDRVTRWNKTVAEETASSSALRERIGASAAGLAGTESIRPRLEQARLAKRLADERVGGARQKLSVLEEIERQRKTLAAELELQRRRLSLLEELREAFGKRGVPTMIIETVVPEVEQEANRLLAGMSGGTMRLRMETQGETKAGAARDTLEIFISDELGTRAYEMFSGGEAFRINFAVRIALSRLLARRSGAQLRALFIDEGFGTQDAAGRERLVAAIQSIQDDFDRILVITHLDELRDAFPARIEVTKTPQGSQVRVV